MMGSQLSLPHSRARDQKVKKNNASNHNRLRSEKRGYLSHCWNTVVRNTTFDDDIKTHDRY